jgi:hypothetical protein
LDWRALIRINQCGAESVLSIIIILLLRKVYYNVKGVDNGGARGAEAPPDFQH